MNEPRAGKSDELLRSFLQATDEAESQGLMARLINEQADPLIKEIIAYKLRPSFDGANDAQESEDVYNNVLMSLLKRLRLAKQQPENQVINNFRGYVATITYNACANLLREKYPQRHILKNRLRYFLTHEAGFALWERQPREWLSFQQPVFVGLSLCQNNARIHGIRIIENPVSGNVQDFEFPRFGFQQVFAGCRPYINTAVFNAVELAQLFHLFFRFGQRLELFIASGNAIAFQGFIR